MFRAGKTPRETFGLKVLYVGLFVGGGTYACASMISLPGTWQAWLSERSGFLEPLALILTVGGAALAFVGGLIVEKERRRQYAESKEPIPRNEPDDCA